LFLHARDQSWNYIRSVFLCTIVEDLEFHSHQLSAQKQASRQQGARVFGGQDDQKLRKAELVFGQIFPAQSGDGPVIEGDHQQEVQDSPQKLGSLPGGLELQPKDLASPVANVGQSDLVAMCEIPCSVDNAGGEDTK
jgi:hypothetical protein